jgi:hypothetical protein
MPIPVAALSKALVFGCWLAGTADSTPARGMDVSLLREMCVVREIFLRQADHSSRKSYRMWCAECDLATLTGLGAVEPCRKYERTEFI